MRTKIVFHVESDEYCDQSETLAVAIQMYEMALVDFYLVVTFPNGLKRTVKTYLTREDVNALINHYHREAAGYSLAGLQSMAQKSRERVLTELTMED